MHQLEHQVASHAGTLPVSMRRDAVRRLDDRGEQRRLGDRQLAGTLPEVEARRLSHAVDLRRAALAEVDLIQVGLEDRLLVVPGLDEQGHHGLGELSLQGLLGGEEEVLDELLGQRARTLTDAPRPEVRDERAGDAAEIDTMVTLEALILDGQHRVGEMTRQVIEPNEVALLPGESVARTHQLGLEQHRTEFPARRDLVDRIDLVPVEPDRDRACGLGPRGMLEGPQMDLQLTAVPAVAARRESPGRVALAVPEPFEGFGQLDQLPVEPGIQDRRR